MLAGSSAVEKVTRSRPQWQPPRNANASFNRDIAAPETITLELWTATACTSTHGSRCNIGSRRCHSKGRSCDHGNRCMSHGSGGRPRSLGSPSTAGRLVSHWHHIDCIRGAWRYRTESTHQRCDCRSFACEFPRGVLTGGLLRLTGRLDGTTFAARFEHIHRIPERGEGHPAGCPSLFACCVQKLFLRPKRIIWSRECGCIR